MLTEEPEVILRTLNETGYVMAGTSERGMVSPLPWAVYEEVCHAADEVLVEADGARHCAVKFPASHEPAVPANADRIIVVCGLHGLGRTIREEAFRIADDTRVLGRRKP